MHRVTWEIRFDQEDAIKRRWVRSMFKSLIAIVLKRLQHYQIQQTHKTITELANWCTCCFAQRTLHSIILNPFVLAISNIRAELLNRSIEIRSHLCVHSDHETNDKYMAYYLFHSQTKMSISNTVPLWTTRGGTIKETSDEHNTTFFPLHGLIALRNY